MRTREDLERLLRASGIPWRAIEHGAHWVIVVPALGARILGAGIGPENALWVAPTLSTGGWDAGGNAGGQRTWIAPETGPRGFFFGAGWSVPVALDPGDYRPAPAPPGWLGFRSALIARAADGHQFPIALTRRVSLEPPSDAAPDVLRIRFQHELENTDTSALRSRVGLWSIIQLPCETKGIVIFRLTDDAAKAGLLPRPYFTALPPDVLRTAASTSLLSVEGGRTYKVGVPAAGCAGVVAFLRRARVDGTGPRWMLTAQKFAVDPAGTYLDMPEPASGGNGDAAQAYNDSATGEKAFCEIEAHAPAVDLPPGARQEAEIEMVVARAETDRMERLLSEELGIEAEVPPA